MVLMLACESEWCHTFPGAPDIRSVYTDSCRYVAGRLLPHLLNRRFERCIPSAFFGPVQISVQVLLGTPVRI